MSIRDAAPDPAPAPRSGRSARDAIVASARQCYAESGVEATRMEDVATRAGVSRQHIYSFVSSKQELVELVVLERLAELGADLAMGAAERRGDVGDQLVDQIVAGIGLGHDPEFAALAEAMSRARLNHILTSRDSPVHAINGKAFAPILARALAEGRLRADVTADSMIEWLQGVMALFAGRDDLDAERQREMIRAYVLPGLLRQW
jgi:AcrR family transcriptional regulator